MKRGGAGARRAPALDPAAPLRAAVGALGGAAVAGSPPRARPTADALTDGLLAIAYRLVVAARAGAPWPADLAGVRALVGVDGPLGALGIGEWADARTDALGEPRASARSADAPAHLSPDTLAAAVLARPLPHDAVVAFLAPLAPLAGAAAPDRDPTGLAEGHTARLALAPAFAGDALQLEAAGAGRRAAGSWYTPPALVDWLLDRALEPALDAASAAPDPAAALTTLRVCDPTCGAGAFLLPAARRVRARLVAAGAADATVAAARCVRGVDLDPLAVLLCRLGLWLDAGAPRGLDAHLGTTIRRGDALLGADGDALAAGLPDAAYAARPGVDAATLRAARARNRAGREHTAHDAVDGSGPRFADVRSTGNPAASRTGGASAPARGAAVDPTARALDAWCAAFFWPSAAGAPPTTAEVRALGAEARRVGPSADAGLAAIARTTEAVASERGFLHWPLAFPDVHARGGFDVVIGNPPFLNQLARDTVASRGAAALVRARFGEGVGAYTDVAALLLLQAALRLRPGGRLGLVLPQSVLSARDARGARDALAARAPPTDLWWAGERVFAGASVHVTALVARRGTEERAPAPAGAPPVLRRALGPSFAPLPDRSLDTAALRGETWTPLVADALGAPALHLRSAGRLGDLARATADFRDEYYGLVPFVVDRADADAATFPRLLLTGHLDPARCWWGERPVRFGKRAWLHPRVDLAALNAEGSLAAWAAGRLRPKLLVATQTRVLEAVADPDGQWLTTTPVVSVLPPPEQLWRVAAVLLSPVASVWALTHHGASALAVGAIKLSARQVEAIPLPAHPAAWDEAAASVRAAHAEGARRRAHLLAAAAAMNRAYGAGEELLAWWAARLPADAGAVGP